VSAKTGDSGQVAWAAWHGAAYGNGSSPLLFLREGWEALVGWTATVLACAHFGLDTNSIRLDPPISVYELLWILGSSLIYG
jgi:hypothetical protein